MLAWFTFLLTCQLAGELLAVTLGLPVPGPVIGMALLFVFLVARGAVPQQLGETGTALTSNLSLMFVPAGVGIMAHGALLKNDWPALGVAVIGSTLLAVAVTAAAMVWLKKVSGTGNDPAGNGPAEMDSR